MRDIIFRLEKLISAKKPSEIKEIFNQLLARVEENFTDENEKELAKAYLKQFIHHLGKPELLDKPIPEREIEPYPHVGEYREYYTHALYQSLLPLFELAYLKEKSGDARAHAFKLSIMFSPDSKKGSPLLGHTKALSYLNEFSTQNPKDENFVSSACDFQLPTQVNSCRFKQWKTLANRNKNAGLANRFLSNLLPHAHIVEKYLVAADRRERKIDENILQERMNRSKEIKDTLDHLLYGGGMDHPHREAKINQLRKEQVEASCALARASCGISIENLNETLYYALYEKYQLDHSPSYRILSEHGIPAREIQQLSCLRRMNDDKKIPNIFMDGADIGYDNLYLSKLNTLTDIDVAEAAVLGKKTNCCQYIGGAGDGYVRYGISSPDSGFYVLYEKDPDNPEARGKVLAKAWLWRGENGALALNSIQARDDQHNQEVSDMFRYMAHLLCANQAVPYIAVGNKSGIKNIGSNVGSNRALLIEPIGYRLYSYSPLENSLSLLLAGDDCPFLFYNQVKSKKLNEKIEKNTIQYFERQLQQDIENNQTLKSFIFQTQAGEQPEILSWLIAVAGKHGHIIKKFIDFNAGFLKRLDEALIAAIKHNNLEMVEYLVENGGDISNLLANSESFSEAIFKAAEMGHLKIFLYLLEKAVKKDPIIFAGRSSRSFKLFLNFLQNSSNESIINRDSEEVISIIIYTIKFPKLFYSLMESLLEEQRVSVLKQPCNDGLQTIFHALLENKELLESIVTLVPTEARLDLFNTKVGASSNETVLEAAVEHPEIFKYLLTSLPPENRADALKQKLSYSSTVFHGLLKNEELVKSIVTLVPIDALLDLFNTKVGQYNQTVLEAAAKHPEIFKYLIVSLPEEKRADALKQKGSYYPTVFHNLLKNRDLLEFIVALVPIESRLDLFNAQHDHTVLKIAAEDPEIFKYLIESLPEEKRADALKQEINSSQTIFHSLLGNEELVKSIVTLVPEDARLDLFNTKVSEHSKTVLQTAVQCPEAFKCLIESLPPEKRADALKQKGNFYQTIFHSLLENEELVKSIVTLVPIEDRVDLFNTKVENNQTVLKAAVEYPESLKCLIASLPEKQRLDIFEEINADFQEYLMILNCFLEAELFEGVKIGIEKYNNLTEYDFNELVSHIAVRKISGSDILEISGLLSRYPRAYPAREIFMKTHQDFLLTVKAMDAAIQASRNGWRPNESKIEKLEMLKNKYIEEQSSENRQNFITETKVPTPFKFFSQEISLTVGEETRSYKAFTHAGSSLCPIGQAV